jgi:hypothetical protein
MTYIPFEDSIDPGFRYEGLARYAFDFQSYGGPNNVAHQAVYNSLFVTDVNGEGVVVLGQILDALIVKNEGDIRAEFIDLKASLSDSMKQMSAIELIDYIIQIIKN